MPDGKVKCYSYIRWSSEQQSSGTTLERQLHTARGIAAAHGLELVELIDKGISAFKGKNQKEGALGAFIDAVENKVIPSDSWLVVENLDRLSRENIIKAQQLFMRLIGLGVTVVTGMDSRIYTKESINSNPTELMVSILYFARAHEESKTKSKRTYGNALALIRKYEAGEKSPEGYAYAIKSVGNNMWWSDCSDGTVKPHPIYYPIAQEIVGLILKGWGSYKIVGYLNDRYPVPAQNKKDVWSYNLVANFHKRRALFGEKTLEVDGQTYVLPDYYPALIDEDAFYRIAHIKKDKISKSTAIVFKPLVSGLNILKCGDCGGNMYSSAYRQKSLRYICGTGQANRGCRAWSFNATWIEDSLLRLAANHVFRPIDMGADFDVEEKALIEKRQDKHKQLERLADAISGGSAPAILVKRIAAIEQDIEGLQRQIKITRLNKQMQTKETVEWDVVDEKALDFSQDEIRENLRFRISNAVEKIVCHQVKQRHIFFRITFINGKSIMAYRTPQTLAFDGGAWVKLGDYFGAKVAVSEQELAVFGMAENEERFVKELEVDNDFAENAISPSEVSGYDGYKYAGLYDVSMEMVKAYESGTPPKELQADILRVQHLAMWADGVKDAPKIIEDQYQVLKHPDPTKVVKKPKPEIYYVEGAVFRSEIVPAWQK